MKTTKLELVAHSIIVLNTTHDMIREITLFRPTAKTRRLIESMQPDDLFSEIILRDKFDDGTEDVHSRVGVHHFVRTHRGDRRKQHTVSLIFEVY